MSNSLKIYPNILKENNSINGDYFSPYIFRNKINDNIYFFKNPIETKLLINGSSENGQAVFVNSYMVPDTSTIDESKIYLNGINNYLNIDNNTDLDFGTNDFTIDCWVKLDTIQNDSIYNPIIETRTNAETLENYTFGLINILDKYYVDFITSTGRLSGSIEVTKNVWHHIAVNRSNNILSCRVDGIIDPVTYSYPGAINRNNTTNTYLFRNLEGNFFKGYFNCLRITKGKSIGVDKFTLPTNIDNYVKNNITFVGV